MIEKFKIMEKPVLSKQAFWDVDMGTIDFEKNAAHVVEKVIERGKSKDFDNLDIKNSIIEIDYDNIAFGKNFSKTYSNTSLFINKLIELSNNNSIILKKYIFLYCNRDNKYHTLVVSVTQLSLYQLSMPFIKLNYSLII